MIERLRDMAPAMAVVGEEMARHVSDNFREQSDPWGNAWRPWSPHTRRLYERGGFQGRLRAMPQKILMNTGALRSVHPSHPSHAAQVAAGGSAAKYAHVQQFGNPRNRLPNKATIGSGKRKGQPTNPAPIPPRPFMPIRPDGAMDFPAELVEDIKDLLSAYILTGAG